MATGRIRKCSESGKEGERGQENGWKERKGSRGGLWTGADMFTCIFAKGYLWHWCLSGKFTRVKGWREADLIPKWPSVDFLEFACNFKWVLIACCGINITPNPKHHFKRTIQLLGGHRPLFKAQQFWRGQTLLAPIPSTTPPTVHSIFGPDDAPGGKGSGTGREMVWGTGCKRREFVCTHREMHIGKRIQKQWL